MQTYSLKIKKIKITITENLETLKIYTKSE